jgi:hypothetical protein
LPLARISMMPRSRAQQQTVTGQTLGV